MRQLTLLLDGMTHTEGARWHDSRFWFSDLYSERIYSIREDGSDLCTELHVPECPSGIGWLPDGRLIAVSMHDRKLLRREHDGTVAVHADMFPHLEFEPNDMVVDAQGRAWVGNLGFDVMKLAPRRPARLARVDPDGSVAMVSEGLHFPNGPTIIDNCTLVVAESFGNRMSAFDIQPDGSLSARRDWASFGPLPQSDDVLKSIGEIRVAADGISNVDAEGAIWVADFTKTRVLRVAPGGRILDEIQTGDRNCYACALGGEDGRTLFLCVTPADFNPDLRRTNPLSAVLSTRVDVAVA
ncbi:SMP-30/gluconolactonase/LRE family protein [Burkholderia sp. Ax-1719]|uniref:SMP-30/gluconolactonase/LRE family protein n=1 Tax=Burkholderia sp. Ax-1719 TaxID=2608334 RepID=UPI001421DD8A|nr:SMP-30/gluconolactonase/LRE family protein [Burkholderia sp. Ax-1719]NIE64463.1 SMP-30/gluconolactonase/LRE family protein [Burkholderia sp. Ax-1719]